MTPRRKRRLVSAACVLLGAAAAAALTTAAFRENLLFFYSPSQVAAGDIDGTRPFRLGGLVAVNSVRRETGALEMRFVITDTAQNITVSYSGVLPDLFHEGRGVVVRGRWDGGVLYADQVLAKHDENYAPPEVLDALAAARTLAQ
ncbi:MAG: cytochrome c maturation protein CcmE [Betaproteobacteria bacterium]|nr:cytochrome c maturation protein CcmE [Betaproteobacteria bacterium]